MQKNQVVGTVAVLIVLIGGGYLFVHRTAPSSSRPASMDVASSSASTTAYSIAGGTLGIIGTGGYTIKEVPIENSAPKPKAPDYNTPLVFSKSSSLSAEQKASIQAQVTSMRAQLAKNPIDYTPWLALGGLFLSAGDYSQTEKIWSYVSLQWPKDGTVLGNLGDLYLTYLKDYPKAEASYLGAIQRDPNQVNAYRNLFSLYSTVYTPSNSVAENILKQGIKNNPDALDLYVSLARHYRDSGRTAEARAEYDVAIAQAKRAINSGATGAVDDLVAEQAALK